MVSTQSPNFPLYLTNIYLNKLYDINNNIKITTIMTMIKITKKKKEKKKKQKNKKKKKKKKKK